MVWSWMIWGQPWAVQGRSWDGLGAVSGGLETVMGQALGDLGSYGGPDGEKIDSSTVS